jgi:hypothetical protein
MSQNHGIHWNKAFACEHFQNTTFITSLTIIQDQAFTDCYEVTQSKELADALINQV